MSNHNLEPTNPVMPSAPLVPLCGGGGVLADTLPDTLPDTGRTPLQALMAQNADLRQALRQAEERAAMQARAVETLHAERDACRALFDDTNPDAVNALLVNILRGLSQERIDNLVRGLIPDGSVVVQAVLFDKMLPVAGKEARHETKTEIRDACETESGI